MMARRMASMRPEQNASSAPSSGEAKMKSWRLIGRRVGAHLAIEEYEEIPKIGETGTLVHRPILVEIGERSWSWDGRSRL